MYQVSESIARRGSQVALSLAAVVCLVTACTPTTPSLTQAAAGKPAVSTSKPPTVPPPAAAHLARWHVHISSTSDWTAVQIPGAIKVAAQKLGPIDADTMVKTLDDGWSLTPKALGGTHSFDTDVVVQRLKDGQLPLRILKGYGGSTSVTIVNTTATAAKTVGTWTDSTHSVTDPNNTMMTPLAGTKVFGTKDLTLAKADSRKLVLAFFYPWWSTYSGPTLADTPSNPRSGYSPAGVDSMTSQARAHGVDGFVLSYAGDDKNGYSLDLALASANKTHGYVAPYLEALQAPDAATLTVWLQQALTRSSDPAFLKSGGKPVVFVFGMYRFPAAVWQLAIDAVGGNVRLVGDTTDPAYASVAWGVHRYSVPDSQAALTSWATSTALNMRAPAAVDSTVTPRLFAGTVSPGFNDSRLRGATNPVVPRSDGTRYSATWAAALAGKPDWVLVTSWNEWFEGTSIEPGISNGAKALGQTGPLAAQWKKAG